MDNVLIDRKEACKRLFIPSGSFNNMRYKLRIDPVEKVPLRPGLHVFKELYSEADINKMYLQIHGHEYIPDKPMEPFPDVANIPDDGSTNI